MPLPVRSLRLTASRSSRGYDVDAATYIRSVENADGQTLEPAVKAAINAFVLGCKADGIWTAIKASCVLMGARTLSGALTPLVGSAPTNNNFVSGDYNRKTGLVGNGSTKYLTVTNAATPLQNSSHQSAYITGLVSQSVGGFMVHIAEWPTAGTAGRTQLATNTNETFTRSREGTGNAVAATSTGFLGTSRAASASYTLRRAGASSTVTEASTGAPSQTIYAFCNPGLAQFSDGRLAWFSVGESLGIALLDTRVSALYTAIGAAIP
jgi:hypothetical protein